MTTAAWAMAAAAVAGAGVWGWWHWALYREAKAERQSRVSRRCQVPPLPPQTNVVRLPPTGLGGVR